MKRKSRDRDRVAGLRAIVLQEGDAIAEALIVHVGCCGLRQHALLLLALANWSEADFLVQWAGGDPHVKA